MLKRKLITAAAAIAAFSTLSAARADEARLEDVQIGEQGAVLRIALICSERCALTPEPGATFMIDGVTATLDVDLGQKSKLATRLTIAPTDGGSMLRVKSARQINEARVVDCQSQTGPAPCLEFRFADVRAAHPAIAKAPPALREENLVPAAAPAKKPAAGKEASTGDIPFIGSLTPAPQPALRNRPDDGALGIGGFGAPERLSPPQKSEAPVKAPPPKAELRTSIRDAADAAAAPVISFNFADTAAAILDRRFGVGTCEGAKARLSADAWALDAMIDLAYCKAAGGELDEADSDLRRLLAYTPDNYQALLGRGLIAIAKGDRTRGLALMQDSLNALPPIADSSRIVAAMRKL